MNIRESPYYRPSDLDFLLPYEDGFRAALQRKKEAENPYSDPADRNFWIDGFYDGEKELALWPEFRQE
jgi:hypothetical protein